MKEIQSSFLTYFKINCEGTDREKIKITFFKLQSVQMRSAVLILPCKCFVGQMFFILTENIVTLNIHVIRDTLLQIKCKRLEHSQWNGTIVNFVRTNNKTKTKWRKSSANI